MSATTRRSWACSRGVRGRLRRGRLAGSPTSGSRTRSTSGGRRRALHDDGRGGRARAVTVPPLVTRARAAAAGVGSRGLPRRRRQAAPRARGPPGVERVAEIGTGAGWRRPARIALPPGVPLFTAEIDQELAKAAAELFADDPDVHVLEGDWRAAPSGTPVRSPLRRRRSPEDDPDALLGIAIAGSTVLMTGFGDGQSGPISRRESGAPRAWSAVEVGTGADSRALVATVRRRRSGCGTSRGRSAWPPMPPNSAVRDSLGKRGRDVPLTDRADGLPPVSPRSRSSASSRPTRCAWDRLAHRVDHHRADAVDGHALGMTPCLSALRAHERALRRRPWWDASAASPTGAADLPLDHRDRDRTLRDPHRLLVSRSSCSGRDVLTAGKSPGTRYLRWSPHRGRPGRRRSPREPGAIDACRLEASISAFARGGRRDARAPPAGRPTRHRPARARRPRRRAALSRARSAFLPPAVPWTSPACASVARCFATAWRVTGSSPASSVGVAAPRWASARGTNRRLGSARARRRGPTRRPCGQLAWISRATLHSGAVSLT